ncbi:hypothetical protein IJG26_00915 [Candidatus Saccharibacteria bacterium]|nr:hypothetical protein [Candidatus Saccharibacteria bacterium]
MLKLRVVIVLVGLTFLSGSILISNYVSANDVVDRINVIVPASCTLSGTGQASHDADIINGTYQADIGTTTIKASCNDGEGFSVYAIGFTGDQYSGDDHTKLIGVNSNQKIITGTAQSGNTSNWAMKLSTTTSPTPTYPITITTGYDSYHTVPDAYTKVATRTSATDVGENAIGSELTTTYAAFISKTQSADMYSGKVKYTLVHPVNETPLQPQVATSGCINYFPNGSNVEGTVGCQTISASATSATLLASNFSRTGYGFAGWSDAFDYATNANAHFYGPQEDITFTAGQYTGTNNGLALYAVWVKSAGSLQDTSKVATLCGTGTGSLTAAATDGTANLASVSALTDQRDNQTYAIAKLADGNCWMIENLRLADKDSNNNDVILSSTNTNNPSLPLTNIYDTSSTSNHLSPTSSIATNTAPEGWCTTISAACDDQSRIRTDNTANRATYTSGQTVSSQDANLYSYGNYYNWYSATAGNGTYSFRTNNNSVDGDLCPTGWRLPKGGDKTRITSNNDDEFWNLIVTGLNGGTLPANYDSNTTPYYNVSTEAGPIANALRTYPNNFLYSGYVSGASLLDRSSYGNYWSSTANASYYAYSLRFCSTSVYPGTYGNNYKFYGSTVRCIAPSS